MTHFQYILSLKKYVFPLWPHTIAASSFSKDGGRPKSSSGRGYPRSNMLPVYTKYSFPMKKTSLLFGRSYAASIWVKLVGKLLNIRVSSAG